MDKAAGILKGILEERKRSGSKTHTGQLKPASTWKPLLKENMKRIIN